MSSSKYLVDANVLLRFLTGEPPAQAEGAKRLFVRAANGDATLEVAPLIVAEAYYTLASFYQIERKEAAAQLLTLLLQPGVKLRDESAVVAALNSMKSTNVSFADGYLAALAAQHGLPVASFDRDFDKFKEITRFDPGSQQKPAD